MLMSKGGVTINIEDMTDNDITYLWESLDKLYKK
jgi:hypothetical protein